MASKSLTTFVAFVFLAMAMFCYLHATVLLSLATRAAMNAIRSESHFDDGPSLIIERHISIFAIINNSDGERVSDGFIDKEEENKLFEESGAFIRCLSPITANFIACRQLTLGCQPGSEIPAPEMEPYNSRVECAMQIRFDKNSQQNLIMSNNQSGEVLLKRNHLCPDPFGEFCSCLTQREPCQHVAVEVQDSATCYALCKPNKRKECRYRVGGGASACVCVNESENCQQPIQLHDDSYGCQQACDNWYSYN